jgi:hypothetical protein
MKATEPRSQTDYVRCAAAQISALGGGCGFVPAVPEPTGWYNAARE